MTPIYQQDTQTQTHTNIVPPPPSDDPFPSAELGALWDWGVSYLWAVVQLSCCVFARMLDLTSTKFIKQGSSVPVSPAPSAASESERVHNSQGQNIIHKWANAHRGRSLRLKRVTGWNPPGLHTMLPRADGKNRCPIKWMKLWMFSFSRWPLLTEIIRPESVVVCRNETGGTMPWLVILQICQRQKIRVWEAGILPVNSRAWQQLGIRFQVKMH